MTQKAFASDLFALAFSTVAIISSAPVTAAPRPQMEMPAAPVMEAYRGADGTLARVSDGSARHPFTSWYYSPAEDPMSFYQLDITDSRRTREGQFLYFTTADGKQGTLRFPFDDGGLTTEVTCGKDISRWVNISPAEMQNLAELMASPGADVVNLPRRGPVVAAQLVTPCDTPSFN